MRFQQDPEAKSSGREREADREKIEWQLVWRKAKGRGWKTRGMTNEWKWCELQCWAAWDVAHQSWLFSIYFQRIFIGSGHRKQITIFIINPNISLPPTGSTHPQSRATLPCFWGRASLPARQLQVMDCEMTGLFVGREARWRPGQLIYGATVVFLLASTPINTWGRLAC